MDYRLVQSADFADEASAVLAAAWKPPALHYSSDYLRWQFTFPGPWPAPASAAFEGSKLAGFAACTHRRVRYQARTIDAMVVSFVAVQPDRRNRGVAAGLYATLLGALAGRGAPLLTFAPSGSAGQRAMEGSYAKAGFALHSLGSLAVYGCFAPSAPAGENWTVCQPGSEARQLSRVIDRCAANSSLIWSDPSAAQLDHYLQDPRERRLLIERDQTGGVTAAAWVVRAEYVTPSKIDFVTSIDCAWLPRDRASSLPDLAFAAALTCSAQGSAGPAVISAPSLSGFDPQDLRKAGVRQMAPPFAGYAASAENADPFPGALGSNLEVV